MASFKIGGLPVRASLYSVDAWTVRTLKRNGEPVFSISRAVLPSRIKTNAWTVRDQFMSVDDPKGAAMLLSRFGPLTRANPKLHSFPATETAKLSWADFLRSKSFMLQFMLEKTPECFSVDKVDLMTKGGWDTLLRKASYQSPNFTLQMGHVPSGSGPEPAPYLDLTALDIFSAVYGSIYIDKMRGLAGRVCEREDCSNTFLSTDPRKRFCDGPADCEATVRMRKKRAAERQRKLEESNGKA